jgi:hypothetical protein
MRRSHSSLLERIGEGLHARYGVAADEPLAERWVDLINYLREKERMQHEQIEVRRKRP